MGNDNLFVSASEFRASRDKITHGITDGEVLSWLEAIMDAIKTSGVDESICMWDLFDNDPFLPYADAIVSKLVLLGYKCAFWTTPVMGGSYMFGVHFGHDVCNITDWRFEEVLRGMMAYAMCIDKSVDRPGCLGFPPDPANVLLVA